VQKVSEPSGIIDQINQFIKAWWKFILSKWLILCVVGLLGGVLGFLYAWSAKPVYNAKLSFILSNERSSGGGLSGLAGQFGLDLGGNADGGFTGENIIEIIRSGRMIKRALFRTMPNSQQLILTKYLETEGFSKRWKKIKVPGALSFSTITNLQPIQDSLLNEVCEYLIKAKLKVMKLDRRLIVYYVQLSTKNPEVAVAFTNALIDETSKFYIETKTRIARKNLDMLQNEADSIRAVLGGYIYQTATETDRTIDLNPAVSVRRVPVSIGQASSTALGIAYGEVIKNLELAKINLQKETPLFQILDAPALPLKAKKQGKLTTAILFAFLFGGLTFLFLGYQIQFQPSKTQST
jgi:uncharacterized protein involved in exopolysaccharide biosynthesis